MLLQVAVDTVPEGPVPVLLVQDADRDAGLINATLVVKWMKADATSYTTLTATTHYTVVEGGGGIYWITFVDTNLFDTPGGIVMLVTDAGALADENWERFYVFTPTDLAETPASLSTTYLNKIADHVLRRNFTTVESSSDGDTLVKQSLIGASAKDVNTITLANNTLTVKKTDGTTTFYTQTATTDPDAENVTGLS